MKALFALLLLLQAPARQQWNKENEIRVVLSADEHVRFIPITISQGRMIKIEVQSTLSVSTALAIGNTEGILKSSMTCVTHKVFKASAACYIPSVNSTVLVIQNEQPKENRVAITWYKWTP